MSKLKISILIVTVVLIGAAAFLLTKNKNTDSFQQTKDKVTLALDWTPNTNHTGIYVAEQNGWYDEENIDLEILPYSSSSPSDVLVATGKADVGIGFTEGVVSASAGDSPVVSIATIISGNTSSVVTRASDNIKSLSELDGKIYGGYGAPYEEPVMRQAIKNDDGKGEFKQVVVDTSPIDALESKKVDFVWIYDGWEGIEAKRRGFDITHFPIVEHGIPNYSTPNIISSPKEVSEKSDLLERFMRATARGYEFARSNPDEAAKILIQATPKGTFPDEQLVYESQKYLSPLYQTKDKKWGLQDAKLWHDYPQFMVQNKAVLDVSGKPVDGIDYNALYTNQFLE